MMVPEISYKLVAGYYDKRRRRNLFVRSVDFFLNIKNKGVRKCLLIVKCILKIQSGFLPGHILNCKLRPNMIEEEVIIS